MGTPVDVDLAGHASHHACDHVPHVIATHLVRAVGEPGGESVAAGVQQQACGLNGIACHANGTGLLLLRRTAGVDVVHLIGTTAVIVGYPGDHAFRPQLEVPGLFGPGNLGIQGGPFRLHDTAAGAKAGLQAGAATIPGRRVDRHVIGVDLAVTHFAGAGLQYFVVVVAR